VDVAVKGYDLKDIPQEKVTWIWEGFLGEGLLTLLASPPKAGKSTLLWHLLHAINEGRPFLEQKTIAKTPTLIFTEESYATLAGRRDSFGLSKAPIHCVTIQPGLRWTTLLAYAKDRIVRHGDRLLVLDTVSRFWELTSEDDAAEQLRALAPLFVFARAFGCGVLLIHHTRKSGGAEGRAVRGSNALTGAVDIIMEFSRLSPYDLSPTRRIETLSRFSATPDRLIATLGSDGYALSQDMGGENEKAIIVAITEAGEGITSAEIAESMDCSERHIQRVLAQLTSRGVVSRHGSGAGKSPFTYTLAGEGIDK
jgi:predicted ATP-dependent serine protease